MTEVVIYTVLKINVILANKEKILLPVFEKLRDKSD